jgi:hypothetical protein
MDIESVTYHKIDANHNAIKYHNVINKISIIKYNRLYSTCPTACPFHKLSIMIHILNLYNTNSYHSYM